MILSQLKYLEFAVFVYNYSTRNLSQEKTQLVGGFGNQRWLHL